MANEKRTAGLNVGLDAGPYIGRVVSHLDRNYMGMLEVEILKADGGASNDTRADGQTFKVKYASPFFGQTPYTGVSKNEDFKYTQQSYGMWFVPPDVGSRVIIVFVEGQPNMGYWIACIPDNYVNYAMPDKAASSFALDTTSGNQVLSATGKVPTGEINKKLSTNQGNDPTKFRKPVDVDHLSVLGNLRFDSTRGLTTSSARRELPSMVFGINTPGPYDKRPGAPTATYGTAGAPANVPFSRLSGHHFVMDDGDDKLLRKGPAKTEPKAYANVEAGETGGDVTIPHNELFRLRTRTGHQILLHNSEDLIHINHGSGDAWIEMSANGKIDIYSKDSISIHTETDLNITADRDINMQAGRNFNVKATDDIQIESDASISTLAGTNTHITSGASSNISSGLDHVETALDIHMNGPLATPATPLSTHVLPGTTATATASLHKRLPQAEPWQHHENVNPLVYTPVMTDRTNSEYIGPYADQGRDKDDTFKKAGN